jgi:Fic family protein
LIVSNDAILPPPFDITNAILRLVASVSEKIGRIDAVHLDRLPLKLRKRNRIRTIEGNTLSEEQISALMDGRRVLGPAKEILEASNALEAYALFDQLDAFELISFLQAHAILMKGLSADAGKLRSTGVGIVKGDKVTHLAPPASNLPYLMDELFAYIKDSDHPMLIKSCVAHYEIEFIHPFGDGNGRMERLWQMLMLAQEYPVFQYLPFEVIIRDNQQEYYDTLSLCDKSGKSTLFIEFMLKVVDEALGNLLEGPAPTMTVEDRLEYYGSHNKETSFTRKMYLDVFKELSTATASRDLRKAVDDGVLKRNGDKRVARYWFVD